jgi:hypothetical protein
MKTPGPQNYPLSGPFTILRTYGFFWQMTLVVCTQLSKLQNPDTAPLIVGSLVLSDWLGIW